MLWAGFAYIMTNKNHTVLYTGATNDLYSRIYEHKEKINPGFTARYNCNKLVYYECFDDVKLAFEREAQIKSWTRNKKEKLIYDSNPQWADLSSKVHADHVDRWP